MLTRIISAAALAAIASTLLVPSAAEAGHRWPLHFFQPQYYTYYPRPHDLYGPDYGDDEDYDSPPLAYYDPDDDYYEPQYQGDEPVYIAPKKKKTAKSATIPKPVAKKPVVAAVNKKPVVSDEKKTAPSGAGMTCDKAEKIVSGYGFTSVKPVSCAGKIFAFNATRSGKAYVIKLSSASGELTEVKKVQ